MCQTIHMMGGWKKVIVAVKDGKAITDADYQANGNEPLPGSTCLCNVSDKDILHLIVDNLESIEDETPIKALMVMREYPGGDWSVEYTRFDKE